MDYGHATVTSIETPPDLNLENWNTVAEESFLNRPIISSKEAISPSEAVAPVIAQPPAPAPELGRITTITPAAPELKSGILETAAVRTDGDHLSESAITQVDQAIERLNQTGDLATFYEEAQALTEANLENSFNRHIGDDNYTGGNH